MREWWEWEKYSVYWWLASTGDAHKSGRINSYSFFLLSVNQFQQSFSHCGSQCFQDLKHGLMINNMLTDTQKEGWLCLPLFSEDLITEATQEFWNVLSWMWGWSVTETIPGSQDASQKWSKWTINPYTTTQWNNGQENKLLLLNKIL